MSYAIRAENVGKKYLIAHQQRERYKALRDSLASIPTSMLCWISGRGGVNGPRRVDREEFWALKDIGFEVAPGERVGIIGRNGAGKSTLLKVLSRITEPTTGRVAIRGRVASLLEVGTGFHPELTGRENIFLNGAILGMTKAEIRRKFDEIVAFSDVEKFLDTPVKRFSSGMYVRLAFAVAAHLEPEILIVDEVLAVGDAEFQAKCLSRLETVSESGRTVVFVSHNLSAVQRLCNTGIFMSSGRVAARGPVSEVLEAYQDAISGGSGGLVGIEVQKGQARLTHWILEPGSTSLSHSCTSRAICRFVFTIVAKRVVDRAYLGLALWDAGGQLILAGSSLDDGGSVFNLVEGEHLVAVEVRLPIKAGTYQLDVSLNCVGEQQIDRWHAEPKLHVLPSGDSSLPENWHGLLNEKMRFEGPTPSQGR